GGPPAAGELPILGARLSFIGCRDQLRSTADEAASEESAVSISPAVLGKVFCRSRLAGERDALLHGGGGAVESSTPVALEVQSAEAVSHQKARADAPPHGGRRIVIAGRVICGA